MYNMYCGMGAPVPAWVPGCHACTILAFLVAVFLPWVLFPLYVGRCMIILLVPAMLLFLCCCLLVWSTFHSAFILYIPIVEFSLCLEVCLPTFVPWQHGLPYAIYHKQHALESFFLDCLPVQPRSGLSTFIGRMISCDAMPSLYSWSGVPSVPLLLGVGDIYTGVLELSAIHARYAFLSVLPGRCCLWIAPTFFCLLCRPGYAGCFVLPSSCLPSSTCTDCACSASLYCAFLHIHIWVYACCTFLLQPLPMDIFFFFLHILASSSVWNCLYLLPVACQM